MRDDPAAVRGNETSIDSGGAVDVERGDDDLAALAQRAHRVAQRDVVAARSDDGLARRRWRRQQREVLDVEAEADCGAVAAEDRADLVVAAAARDRVARAARVRREARAAVVRVAARVGEVEADPGARMCFAGVRGEAAQLVEGARDRGALGKTARGLGERRLVAVEADERFEALARRRRKARGERAQLDRVLGGERGVDRFEAVGVDRDAGEDEIGRASCRERV